MSNGLIQTRDENAREVAVVPLQNGRKGACIIDLDDWQFLISLGMSTALNRLKNGTIVTPCSRSNTNWLVVARILMDAREGEAVICRDGDNSNLRRSNLVKVVSARSYRHDRQILIGSKPVRYGEELELV